METPLNPHHRKVQPRRSVTAGLKSGSALIIALGFLTLLTMLAVSFAIQMRMERLAGRSYLQNAINGQLLDTALSRSLADLDRLIANDAYPRFLAIGSDSDEALLSTSRPLHRNSTDLAYIPGALHSDFKVAYNKARWQTIQSPQHNGTPAVIGRIGYVVINQSGLLDANTSGGLSSIGLPEAKSRGNGESTAEIQLDPLILPELPTAPASYPLHASGGQPKEITASTALVYNRQTAWRQFETLREFHALNQLSEPNILQQSPQFFCTHSSYSARQTPLDSPLIDLSRPADISPDLFKATLKRCGLHDSDQLYEAFLDYCDSDSIPRSLTGGCTEAVPMLNEIWFDQVAVSLSQAESNAANIVLSGHLHIETWYPFAATHPEATTHELLLSAPAPAGDITALTGVSPENASCIVTLTLDDDTTIDFPLRLSPSAVTARSNFLTRHYEISFDDTIEMPPFQEPPEPLAVALATESAELFSPATNAALDRTSDIRLEVDKWVPGRQLSHEQSPEQTPSLSCIDPRLNERASSPAHWLPADQPQRISENGVNLHDQWGEEGHAPTDTFRLYVRNSPMKNGAELGFLSTGTPWRTIRLYTGSDAHPMHPVLDWFTVGPVTAQRGLININSTHAPAIACGFVDAPVRLTPEHPGTPISSAQALEMAERLVLAQANLRSSNRRLSALGHAVNSRSAPTDSERESIIANSHRLFGWQDNLFAICLLAQSARSTGANITDDHIQGTRRAIAYVHRDPLTGKNTLLFYGLHEALDPSGYGTISWSTILEAFRP